MADYPQVLVLTAPGDSTADMVVTHLDRDGIPYLRADPARFPTDASMTGEIAFGGAWRAELDGVQLDEVRAVYHRRPGRFVFDTSIPLDMIQWCEGQARFGFWGVLESLPALWVNSPGAVSRAEYKPRQLAHAARASLPFPATLVTSDPDAVAEFGARHPGGIVTKTLYARMPRTETGDIPGVVYTNTVPPDRYRDPSIAATAHLFQAKLAKLFDVRVTVVGDDIFATRIDNPTELDWRRSHHNVRYQAHELPEDIHVGISRLMTSLDLTFGALDFVATDDGYQFIEINPNGQWGWIQLQTGQPIARALADTLKGAL
jgi:ATP-grasp ribosomal peptide maturase